MQFRVTSVMVIVVIGMMASAGCDDDGRKSATGKPTPDGNEARTPMSAGPAKTHTAEELKKALIALPTGATNAISESGTYDKLLGKFGIGDFISAGVKLDKPQCARATPKMLGRAPMAFVSFAQGSKFTGEYLTSISDAIAERVATAKTPAACRSVTLRWKKSTETIKVLSDDPVAIGKGGRIKEEVDTMQGQSDHSWTVYFYGPGYTGNVDMAGNGTTRAEVLAQARLAYEKASATLG
jgi:hypothetical protein